MKMEWWSVRLPVKQNKRTKKSISLSVCLSDSGISWSLLTVLNAAQRALMRTITPIWTSQVLAAVRWTHALTLALTAPPLIILLLHLAHLHSSHLSARTPSDDHRRRGEVRRWWNMTERLTDGERTVSWQTYRRASVAEGEEKTGVGEGEEEREKPSHLPWLWGISLRQSGEQEWRRHIFQTPTFAPCDRND